MSRPRRFAAAVSAAALLGLASCRPGGVAPAPEPARRVAPTAGVPFLDGRVEARAVTGEKLDVRAPDGGALVVVFYGAADPAGDAALKAAAGLAREFPARSLLPVGVCVDPDATDESVARHARGLGLTFPVARDPRGALAKRFRVGVGPEAFVLVGDGRLCYRGGVGGLRDAAAAVLAGAPVPGADRAPVGRKVADASPGSKAEAPPTFAADVAPILRRSCVACHRPGQSGPFPLLTYGQARKRARDLVDVVERRLMPPWKPTPGEGPPLLHDRTLLASEVATLRAWVDAGCPEGGDAAATPPPSAPAPAGPEGWALGTPDLVLEMAEDFNVPAEGGDIYRCFVLPTNLPEDRAVTAIEVRPGNPRVVHHTFAYIDVRGLGRSRDRDDPGPGYSCFSGFSGDRIFGALGGWAPGNEPHPFGEGVGLTLPRGADVVVQVHYHPSGKPEKDRTRLGFHFARRPVRQSLQWISACADPDDFDLPAGDPGVLVRTRLTVPVDVELHALTPHMHLLGRMFAASVEYPDGRTKPLILIDDWDFNRQETYYLREPLLLPKGSVVRIEGRFDNSEGNPRNPSRPPRGVRWGEATTDDMLILFLALTQAGQDLTRPGARDDFMETFFRAAAGAPNGRAGAGAP